MGDIVRIEDYSHLRFEDDKSKIKFYGQENGFEEKISDEQYYLIRKIKFHKERMREFNGMRI